MGTTYVTIEVGDTRGERFESVEVMVDTGSTYTALPGSLLRRLGVPVVETAQSELADGRMSSVEVGDTIIRLEGRQFPTPVIFGEEGEPCLLGVMALERARLGVDPVGRRLVPVNLLRLGRCSGLVPPIRFCGGIWRKAGDL